MISIYKLNSEKKLSFTLYITSIQKRSKLFPRLLFTAAFFCEYITKVRRRSGRNPKSDRDQIKKNIKRNTAIEMELN